MIFGHAYFHRHGETESRLKAGLSRVSYFCADLKVGGGGPLSPYPLYESLLREKAAFDRKKELLTL